jgi:hypothetical protein
VALRLLYVTWQDGRLGVQTLGADEAPPSVACSADQRYDVRLSPRGAGAWVRAPIEPRSPFAAATAGQAALEPCEPVPGQGPVRLSAASADAVGGLAVIGDDHVHVRHPTGGPWRSIVLPAAFRAKAAGHGYDGSVWIAGSSPARRLRTSPREAALLRCLPGSSAMEPVELRLRPLEAWRTIRHGGFEQLSGIEASAKPVTATSASPDLHHDPWEFVLTQSDGGLWRAKPMRGQTIRAVLTLDGLRAVVTSQGQVFVIDTDGTCRHRIHPEELAAAIDAAGRLIVRGADALGSDLALVVGTYEPQPEGMLWLTNGILLYDGHTLELVHQRAVQDGEGELLDVVIAR